MLLLILLGLTSSLVVILSYKLIVLQKEHHRLLQDTKEDEKVLFLKSRYTSMGETLGNIAHQWKQPLNAIGTIQNGIKAALIFQGEISKEKLLNSVETSFKLLQHLAETIDTFYSFLAQRGDDKMSFIISEELEKVRKITEYSFKNSNIVLKFELEVNPTIRGNANEFTHAILNLILNAKDAFDDEKIVNPTISVQVLEKEKTSIIIVSDNAGGIRIKPIDMVFDLHITTKESGSGLGLFMTKNIIENRFGGKITVKNKKRGACFTIELHYEEYSEHHNNIITVDEQLTLERINQLSHKIIELEEVEKALKKWADIFKQAHWAIAIHVGTSNTFELTNAAFQKLYGYTAAEFKTLSVSELFTPESLPMFENLQKEAFVKGYITFEAVHKRKDGSTFPVSVELIIIKDEEGEILYHMENIWDLSEKKAAERDLLLINKAFNNTNEATYIMIRDRFIQVNDGACKMLGYSHQEFAVMTLSDIDSDVTEEHINAIKDNVEQHITYRVERQHRTKDGRILDVEIVASFFEHDGVTYSFAATRDITKQKKAREELLLKEFALNTINEAVYLIDENSMFHYVNEGACSALGYTKEELFSMSVSDIDPNVSTAFWKEHWKDIKRLGTTLTPTQHKRKDGSIYPIEVSSNYFEYNGTEYSLAVARDITERKLLEQQKDNERMRLFFERQLVGMAIVSSDKKWLQTNQKLQEMLGYTHEELDGHTCVELTYPDDIVADLELFGQLLKGEIDDYMLEKRFYRKDGTIVYTKLAVSCVRNDDRSVNYVLVLLEDITEQKHTHKSLVARERELRALADSSPGMMGAFHLRSDGSFSMPYVSPNIIELFGLNPHDVREDATLLMALNHPEDTERIHTSILESAQSMSIWHEEYRIIHPTRGIRWMESHTKPELHPEGGIIWYGYVHDITERKKLEALLEKERKFLIDAQRVSHTGSWYLDIRNDILTWSDETYRIFEFDKEHIDDLHKAFYECVHPEDREMVQAPYLESLNTKLPYKIEHRIVMRDGRIKYVIESCEHVYDHDGIQLYSIGTVQDITVRKQLEEKLSDSYAFLNQLIDSVPDSIFVKNKEHIWVLLNKAFCELIGQSRELLIGKSDYDFFPKEEADVFWEKDELVFQSGESNHNEESFTATDGTTHHIETVKSMFVGRDGKEYLIGTIRNITERKQIEDKLQSNRNLLHAILESSPDVITFALDTHYRYIAFDSKHAYVIRTMFGKEIAIDMDMFDVIGSNADSDVAKRSFDRALAGESFIAEEEYGDEGLSRHYWQIYYAPIYSESNEIIGLTCFNMDITKRKQAEKTIQELNASLENNVQIRTAQLQNVLMTMQYEIDERKKIEHILREREETFRAIVENSPDVISRYDLQMCRTYVNPMMQYLLGKPLEEILGKTPHKFSPLPDIEKFEQLFNMVVRTGTEIEYEGEYLTTWGEKRWGNQRIIPEFDNDHNVISVMVIGRDITVRIEAEKRLKLLEIALNNANDAIYVIDDNSSIIYANDASCTMLGYTKDELLSMKIYEVDVYLSKEQLSVIESSVDREKTVTFETKHKTKEDCIIDVLVTMTYFEYENIRYGVSLTKSIH
ncbi:MAG: PAS domain S-box protein [Sulfuricurvum sp.]|uniref:PAS domain S-box protein n=1 Tax=Sulfuricurvum sp. TaxID=2025608 RepID=UPI00262B7D19|nr:PAS domain S-box protein [Sulfuricurvum sp.]MDD2830041.1 PAS domain S-box protein [Sulfuricurvum sp.]